MLPARSRLRTPAEHTLVARRGRRVTRGPLTLSVAIGAPTLVEGPSDDGPRVGFVVSRKVGNAVVRNRVRRRMREQMRARLDRLPLGVLLVVRALPSAAGASSADIGSALDGALRAALPKLGPAGRPTGPRP